VATPSPLRETSLDPAAGEVADGLPAWAGNALLAALALALAVLPFLAEPAAVLRLFDLPVNALLFVATTWIAVRARHRVPLVLAGMVLTAMGLSISILGLALDRTHPWR